MKKCTICGVELNEKTIGLNNILDSEERNRLEKIRKNNGYCSECSITLMLLNLM
jgi:hypothetical protein